MEQHVNAFEFLASQPLLIKKIEDRKLYLSYGEINITLDIPEEKEDQMKNFKVGDHIIIQELN